VIERDLLPIRFTPGAGISGVFQAITLATGNNTITIPTGAIAMLLELPPTATTPPVLTVKGIAGDTGVVITPTSNPAGVPLLLPLGTSPVLVINNAGSAYTANFTFA
jgi:hypothetical protein